MNHILSEYLGYKECRGDVEVEYELQTALFEVEEGLAALGIGGHILIVAGCTGVVSAGTVDEEVYLAPLFVNNITSSDDALFYEAVGANADCVFANGLCNLLRCLFVDVKECYLCATFI